MFITVFSQVCVLMILILLGFAASKTGLLTEAGSKCCSDIVMYLVTPCVIIKSLMMPYNTELLKTLLICFGFSLLLQVIMILLSLLLLRSPDSRRERVLRFGAVFTNCGFMSLPLQEAILGDEGVRYGSAYIIIFQLLIWSWGVMLMSGGRGKISLPKLVINPGMIGLAIGLIIFLFSLPMPQTVSSAIGHMAALNTPVPMLVIGHYLAHSDVRKALKDLPCLWAVFLRMFLFPFLLLGLLYLLQVRGTMLVSLVISISAPTAAITTMFSVKYENDTACSVNLISLSTLVSLLSMPLLITVARLLA